MNEVLTAQQLADKEWALFVESFKIMAVGMTTVFAFLLLLICVLKLQGWFVTKYFPPKAVAPAPVSPSVIAPETLKAIAQAAIDQYLKKHQ